jgi:1-acyl-sn-glycerol-3-phosphate acyltransferase
MAKNLNRGSETLERNVNSEHIRLERDKLLFFTLRNISRLAIKTTSFKHYDIPEVTQEIMDYQKFYGDISILYVGLHKSLWETIGVPYAINKFGGEIPFVMMGSNLVKKSTGILEHILRSSLERSGVVIVDRDDCPRLSSAQLASDIEYLLSNNIPTMLFPEGTRSKSGIPGDFKSAGFQGVIDAAKHGPTAIIPFNVDYSSVNEAKEYLKMSTTPYSFKFKELPKWFKNFGDIYISFGLPIVVDSFNDRKSLAIQTRNACLDLVKIQPVNILSEAMLRLNPVAGSSVDMRQLYGIINSVLIELLPHKEKFQGIMSGTPEEIITNSNLLISSGMDKMYNIYAGYIRHYIKR